MNAPLQRPRGRDRETYYRRALREPPMPGLTERMPGTALPDTQRPSPHALGRVINYEQP